MGRFDGAPRAFRLPPLDLAFNPVVAFFALGIIWAFIVACIVVPVEFTGQIWWWKRQILATFLWLYYLCENIWILFIIWLCYSKWGKFILGENQKDNRPEYSDLSWFFMMFSTGMGIALFMFGASEPIYHLEQSLRYSALGQSSMSYNLASKEALMLAYFHFGIHAWVPFAIVGIALAIARYRCGLPLAMRSAFYPIIRDYIYGWLGDFIDILSALVSFVGVATLVGFAAIQVAAGINYQSGKIPYIGIDGKEIQNYKTLIVIIWAPCFLAVLSLAGVVGGSRYMTHLAIVIGSFLALMVLFLDDTWYIMNLMVEIAGYYLWNLVRLSHHLDAFEQLDAGIDFADGQSRLSPWFDGWAGNGWYGYYQQTHPGGDGGYGKLGMTGIYWGWWMSLAPVVGLWIAKISKGRSIRQLVLAGVVGPMAVSLMWICIFGGAAIRMQRQAILDGCRCNCNSTGPPSHRNGQAGSQPAFDRTYCSRILSNPTGAGALSLYYQGTNRVGEPAPEQKTCLAQRPPTPKRVGGCSNIIQLAKRRPELRWFDLVNQYPQNGDKEGTRLQGSFLRGLTIVALLVLIPACASAGDVVIASLMSGGEELAGNGMMRFFILGTECALASVLVRAGADDPTYDAATLLQSMSVVFGIFFAALMTFFPFCIYYHLQDCDEGLKKRPTNWSLPLFGGFLDYIEFFLSAFRHPPPPFEELLRFILCLFFPYCVLPVAYSRIDPIPVWGVGWFPLLTCWTFFWFWVWICCLIVEAAPYYCKSSSCFMPGWTNGDEGLWAIAWCGYIAMIAAIACCRNSTRKMYNIRGNAIFDLLSSLFLFPLVICQISAQEVNITDNPFEIPATSTEVAPNLPNQFSTREVKKHVPAHNLYSSGPAVDPRTLPGMTEPAPSMNRPNYYYNGINGDWESEVSYATNQADMGVA